MPLIITTPSLPLIDDHCVKRAGRNIYTSDTKYTIHHFLLGFLGHSSKLELKLQTTSCQILSNEQPQRHVIFKIIKV